MRSKYQTLPTDAAAFIEESVRRGGASARQLSLALFEEFGIRRGQSWLGVYIRKLRPQIAEDVSLERRMRLLKRELGDRPDVLAKVAADVMRETPELAARRRRNKAAAR